VSLFLGVDVATRTGWAIVEATPGREVLRDHGIVDATSDTPLWEQIDAVLDRCHHSATVAIELPYLADNPHTLEVLARLCGQWEAIISMRAGFDVVMVKASQWQSAILTGLTDVHSKRAQRKRASKMWCLATYGVDLDEDRSDAAALATWAARTSRARGLGIGR
jgi:Holliday junction resolvasome RuvABC endonuclease subunit